MGLIDQAKADIQRITSDLTGFAVPITLYAPTGQIAIIAGLHSKIHLGVDDEGNLINSRKANASFSEQLLTDLNYPVRDLKGEVNLKGHKLTVMDSSGRICSYVFLSVMPDETIGLITCVLEVYNGSL